MSAKKTGEGANDEGFMLVAVIVMIFLILLALSVAAPRIARQLQHDRERESARRADQYVRAIRKYYLKFQHYPGSLEQLVKTNNQRFLRQKYIDPLTGKADWRLIPVGKNKTKVKGFFGEDLPGLATGGLGSAASLQSDNSNSSAFGGGNGSNGGANGGQGSTFGGSGFGGGASRGGGFGSSSGGLGGSSSFGSPNSPGSNSQGSGSSFGSGGASGSNGSFGGADTGAGVNANSGGQSNGGGLGGSGIASQNATDYKGDGGPLMGIGSAKSGEAILVVNEQTNYQDWEFLYDPRLEAMRAKATLLGGGGLGSSGSGFGSNNSNGTSGSPFGNNSGAPPGGGFGTSTFGSGAGSGSSFGNPGQGTGFGSSAGSGAQTTPPTPPSTPP